MNFLLNQKKDIPLDVNLKISEASLLDADFFYASLDSKKQTMSLLTSAENSPRGTDGVNLGDFPNGWWRAQQMSENFAPSLFPYLAGSSSSVVLIRNIPQSVSEDKLKESVCRVLGFQSSNDLCGSECSTVSELTTRQNSVDIISQPQIVLADQSPGFRMAFVSCQAPEEASKLLNLVEGSTFSVDSQKAMQATQMSDFQRIKPSSVPTVSELPSKDQIAFPSQYFQPRLELGLTSLGDRTTGDPSPTSNLSFSLISPVSQRTPSCHTPAVTPVSCASTSSLDEKCPMAPRSSKLPSLQNADLDEICARLMSYTGGLPPNKSQMSDSAAIHATTVPRHSPDIPAPPPCDGRFQFGSGNNELNEAFREMDGQMSGQDVQAELLRQLLLAVNIPLGLPNHSADRRNSSWRRFRALDGRAFYYDELTGKSQWQCPLGFDASNVRSAASLPSAEVSSLPQNPVPQAPSSSYGPPGSNLFIFHIPSEWDDSHLIQHFMVYGVILSARIRRDATGRNIGYGFVSFDSPQSAQAAIRGMHGHHVGGKFLKVTLKKGEEHLLPADLENYVMNNGEMVASRVSDAVVAEPPPPPMTPSNTIPCNESFPVRRMALERTVANLQTSSRSLTESLLSSGLYPALNGISTQHGMLHSAAIPQAASSYPSYPSFSLESFGEPKFSHLARCSGITASILSSLSPSLSPINALAHDSSSPTQNTVVDPALWSSGYADSN